MMLLFLTLIILFICPESSYERTFEELIHNAIPNVRNIRAGNKLRCKNPKGVAGTSYTKLCIKYTCTKAKWKKKLDPSCCNHNGKGFAKNTTISTNRMKSGCDWSILKCVDKKGQPIIEVEEFSNCTSTTKCSCPTAQCTHTSKDPSVGLTTNKMGSPIHTSYASSIPHAPTKNIHRSTTITLTEKTFVQNPMTTPQKVPTLVTKKQPTANVLTKFLTASFSANITRPIPTTVEKTLTTINIIKSTPRTFIFTKFTSEQIPTFISTTTSSYQQPLLTTSSEGSFLTIEARGKEVLLNGGLNESSGNVLIGNLPVCDDDWDLVDANVTCRMLGFSGAVSWTFGSEFGNVAENFLMSHVNCSGQEDSLLDCPHKDGDDCGSCMAAGVVCQYEYKIELRGGSGVHDGNVFFGNQPVCDKNWNLEDANVACKMLGFHGAEKATTSSEFGSVPKNFMMANVACQGNESSLKNCSHSGGTDCNSNDGAGVVCLDNLGYMISLKDGKAAHRGHVYIGNFPVCSDGWDLRDATVACRMLGYAGAEKSFEHDLDCEHESDSLMITGFGCSGIEHSLYTCPHIVNSTCGGRRAGVICFPANSTSNMSLSYKFRAQPHGSGEGNVFFNNQPICDDDWDNNDAKVACKMLGYSGGTATIRSAYGMVPDNFIMDNVQCLGTESSLSDCPRLNGNWKCGSHEGAGVKCSTSGLSVLKLVGGTVTQGAASGNVYLGDSPVCGTGWDTSRANEICRMLGYVKASKISVLSLFGEVTTTSMVYEISCRGDEWGLAACSYTEDGNCPAVGAPKGAGVVCQGYRAELRGGATEREGDVFITNQPVHYAGWGIEDAKVVCRMLGFSGAESASIGKGYPRYTYFKVSSAGCTGDEDNLADCPHTPTYYSSSSYWAYLRGAWVVCFY